jgi:hypothetical protein
MGTLVVDKEVKEKETMALVKGGEGQALATVPEEQRVVGQFYLAAYTRDLSAGGVRVCRDYLGRGVP